MLNSIPSPSPIAQLICWPSMFKSLWNEKESNWTVQRSNIDIDLLNLSYGLLMYTKKKAGPSTEPWETPEVTPNELQQQPSYAC